VASRLHRSQPARRTTMQPAQLSLLPTQFATPPEIVLVELPEAGINEAITLLARLIAKAAAGDEVPADE
jgi:hypothetical protein